MSGTLAHLLATVTAARELMVQRLAGDSLAPEEKREMEVALKELDVMWAELERYAEFFEYAPDACLITDVGGRVREANQAARELLVATRADVLGRSLSDYIGADERIGRVTNAAWKGRVQPIGRTAVEVEVSVRPIALRESELSGLCWLMRDVASS